MLHKSNLFYPLNNGLIMKLTPEQRDKLQDDYVHQIVDDMDLKCLCAFVYDTISGSLDDYSTEELITEVKEYYPDLLEE